MNCSILIITLLSLAAIQTAPSTVSAAAPSTAPSVVSSADGSIELSLPPTWQVITDQKHRDFQLFVAGSLGMSVGVKTYVKDDQIDMNLEKMDETSREGLNFLTDLQTGDAREV